MLNRVYKNHIDHFERRNMFGHATYVNIKYIDMVHMLSMVYKTLKALTFEELSVYAYILKDMSYKTLYVLQNID